MLTLYPTHVFSLGMLYNHDILFLRFPSPTASSYVITAANLKNTVQTRDNEKTTNWSWTISCLWSSNTSWDSASSYATMAAILAAASDLTNDTVITYNTSAPGTVHSFDMFGSGSIGVQKSYEVPTSPSGFTLILNADDLTDPTGGVTPNYLQFQKGDSKEQDKCFYYNLSGSYKPYLELTQGDPYGGGSRRPVGPGHGGNMMQF